MGVTGRSSMQTGVDVQSGTFCQDPKWCAVHTRHQYEQQVNGSLRTKGFQTFLPTFMNTHEWTDRKKRISEALFPGYLFVADVGEQRLQIVSTPGVCAIVSVAGVPAIISNDEIEAIRRAMESPYNLEPHPYLKEGNQVQVMHGPLAGVKGILVREGNTARLVLLVEILGRAAAVEIDRNCVRPLAQPGTSSLAEGTDPPK
jgi:transcription antitermination factor NusG